MHAGRACRAEGMASMVRRAHSQTSGMIRDGHRGSLRSTKMVRCSTHRGQNHVTTTRAGSGAAAGDAAAAWLLPL